MFRNRQYTWNSKFSICINWSSLRIFYWVLKLKHRNDTMVVFAKSKQFLMHFIRSNGYSIICNNNLAYKEVNVSEKKKLVSSGQDKNFFEPQIFCMYILIKRDTCPKLFLLCKICGFMCNNKSINKSKISKIENYF